MRKKVILMILALCPILMSFSTTSTKVDFFRGSMSAVKERAATEGKLYFVDFTASWCMPCRWMDETTFSDAALAQYVKDNYIAVKIDIDDFDGYAMKQVHNIKLLPSILIFNSKGKEVARFEESLSPSRFMEILKKYNTAANRVITKTKPAAPSTKPSGSISRPPLGSTKPAKPSTPPATSKPKPPKGTAPIMTGEGLYRFKVSRQASEGFSVQIGAFAEYGNVLTEAARLEKLFDKPIIVHIAKLRDRRVYKVLIGEFDKREEAVRFKEVVKAKGIEAIIKDLSMMR